MYLWQIRHIPIRPQTLLRLTFIFAMLVSVDLTPYFRSISVFAQQADNTAEKGTAVSKGSDAAEFFERVRQELQKHQSVKADLVQNVTIGDQQFKIIGQYLSSGNMESGIKLKLNYSVIPEQGVQGEMLEVSDGKELWTKLTLTGAKPRVTHRNLAQIQKAVASSQRNSPEVTLNVELGLGGLTALFASLDRTMKFDVMKEDKSGDHPRTIIQAQWKKEVAQRFVKNKDEPLPAVVPDAVRMYVNSETLFPDRIVYLKKQPEKKGLKSLVSLEFQNVEFDGDVDDNSFVFEIPKDVIPEDITKVYLDRLSGVTETPSAKK